MKKFFIIILLFIVAKITLAQTTNYLQILNYIVLPQTNNIPTNKVPASSASQTNYILINWTNVGPVFVATNIGAAGSFKILTPLVTNTTWP